MKQKFKRSQACLGLLSQTSTPKYPKAIVMGNQRHLYWLGVGLGLLCLVGCQSEVAARVLPKPCLSMLEIYQRYTS